MSHMRAKAVEVVIASVEHAMGTVEERMHAFPIAATQFGGEQMDGLDLRERQLLLWELTTLLDDIRKIGVERLAQDIRREMEARR